MSEGCRHEVYVRRAASENAWSESLREHIGTCVECRAAAAIAPTMSKLAVVDNRSHPLPAPAVIWLKAQLLRGTAVIDRVSRPMSIMQVIAYVTVAAGWAGMVMWKWSDMERMVRAFTPTTIATGAGGLSVTLLAGLVVLGSMTFALAMHTILAED
jgi:predicted histidine transporter YuiF (NhaC family)